MSNVNAAVSPVAFFGPDSPGWEKGVRLDPCPVWCDGTHECIANDEDAIHTSEGIYVNDAASPLNSGASLYVESYPLSAGEPQVAYVVCDSARLTPDGARRAAAELNRLADLLEGA